MRIQPGWNFRKGHPVTVDDPEYSSVLALSRFRRSRKIEAAFELSYQSGERLCFAQNLFFGMTKAPFQAHFLTSLGPKKPCQVSCPSPSRLNFQDSDVSPSLARRVPW